MNTREFFEQKMIHCPSVFHPKNHSRSSKTIFALVPKLFEVMRQNKIVALMDFLHSKPRKNELEASFLLFVRFWHVKIHNCKGWIDHFTFCRKVEKKIHLKFNFTMHEMFFLVVSRFFGCCCLAPSRFRYHGLYRSRTAIVERYVVDVVKIFTLALHHFFVCSIGWMCSCS